ncbi:614/534 cytochrome P450 [Crepidotus variabilis]|uniref:614/534 cytochrome P450 n=1 Tax=Crepidotus variabilis TaxID=179855 RepID=A0A9P6EGZ3_9AGAR|nr:614/534 cytochrome P450 [Crepidotus variabilis]
MGWILGLLALALTVYVFDRVSSLWKAFRSLNFLPGSWHLFDSYSLVAALFPPIPLVNPGNNHHFEDKHAPFAEAGCDIISIISLIPVTTTNIMLSDAEAINEVTSARARFPKPIDQYEVLSLYGQNIVASEGEQWKRFRKISAPAFSDDNNKLVWEEAARAMSDLFEEWKSEDVISVKHGTEITMPITLQVIGAVAFGTRLSWKDPTVPPGHRMTFRNSLRIMCEDLWLKLFLPERVLRLTKKLNNIQTAFEELQTHVKELIDERVRSEKEPRDDIFSTLIDANAAVDSESVNFADQDLISNIYIILLAGHETTAHTLCMSFALLALYPEEQDKLLKQVKAIMPNGKLPPYEDLSKFSYSMAILYETMRLFPPTPNVPKMSVEDTTLTTRTANGEKLIVPVPKGTKISLNIAALHYNPRYWENPHSFKPARFLKNEWNRDAFIPFSAGARACLGRRFAEAESVVVLSLLILKYRISITEDPKFSGETLEQRRERVLKMRNSLTLTPVQVPLTFTRRA